MKILRKNLRSGKVAVGIESVDDIWHLSQVVEAGDFVSGKTTRKVKATEKEATKKTLTLEVAVEEVEFSNRVLRVSGTTTLENDDVPKGSHHTITVEEGSSVSIVKKSWPQYALKRLEEASKVQRTSLILVMDREEAVFALLKSQGYEVLSQLKGKVAKKGYDTVTGDFYGELAGMLEGYNSRLKPESIIVASPAFWKDEFISRIGSEGLRKKVVVATCSSSSPNAIEEVLKRPELASVLRQQRAADESRLVEQLMAEIGKDGLAIYGINEVSAAIGAGNVQKLLVTDSFISSNRKKSESLMKGADSVKGDVVIINSENEAGMKLDSLGGVAVISRYKAY